MTVNMSTETPVTYRQGVRKTLRAVIDLLALIAGLLAVANLFRIGKFGSPFIVTTLLLVFISILPTILLRRKKYLSLSGGLTVAGLVITNFVGMIHLGMGAAAIFAFPFYMALCAALFSRKLTVLFFFAFSCAFATIAYLFVTGVLVSPDPRIADWNKGPDNWIVLLIALMATNMLVITLVTNLSRYWKETENEATDKALQFETLVEYAPDAIVIYDIEKNHFISANGRAVEFFGYDRNTLVRGLSLVDLSPEKQPSGELSATQARQYLEAALDGETPIFHWRHLNASGEEIDCEISLTRLPPFRQKLIRANIADISKRLADQKQSEDLQSQLAASQRLETIGQLTGGVAHDFNNLLAVILGNLELLQDEPDTKKRADYIASCIGATMRGADLTRSMLSYARRTPLQPEVVNLNKLVLDTKNWAGRTLPSHIEVETSLLARLWDVEVDPGLAESALLNLILNARDAMSDSGKLTIETANVRIDQTYQDSRNEALKPGRYVMIAVSDTGQGIDPEIVDKIFDPFFTTKPSGEGSGLGLSMVLGFMRQSEGTAQVYSEPSVGTTFKLYFPAMSPDPSKAPAQSAAAEAATFQGKRILLAEDEEEVLLVLKSTLEQAGYSVTTASNGDAAKEIFEADPTFDLLLTDIVMPGRLKGTCLATALRVLKTNLPVVFMSGYAAEATVHGNGLRPEDIRLMKPIMRGDLLEAISKALGTAHPEP
ncbi:ATP-binding protein [Pseudophaeobacter arcticus]|uniref:ATP-binding protein n=1 Tax=Pseudophaeobacter arcticus TaxID=385492 RepID=UPI000A04C8B4|nr:ATP-binding protein [Pseudophaeobacter arcticus]